MTIVFMQKGGPTAVLVKVAVSCKIMNVALTGRAQSRLNCQQLQHAPVQQVGASCCVERSDLQPASKCMDRDAVVGGRAFGV